MRRTIAVAVGLMVVAVACGSDDPGESGSTTPPGTDAPEPEPAATEAPEPATTDAQEPAATQAPAPTDAPEPEPTDPPETTTTTEPRAPVNAIGLVPLPGTQLDFTGQPVPAPSLVWSLFSGSGGIIVENVGGPLPPGCHGTSFFDPTTFDLLQIDGDDAEAYATRGEGGCDGMQQDMADGVVDGDAVKINTDDLIMFDFGALPAPPFDVSTQVVEPGGGNGVFRSADPLDAPPENRLDDTDITHVVGADVLLEIVDGRLNPITEPPPAAGACVEFDLCLSDRFGIDVVDVFGAPGQALVSGERSALFTFLDEDDWQALVRIVNGCGFNDHFWVFAAATTDIEFDVTVTDTVTGDSRSYASSFGNLAEAVLDTQAFATCP